MYTLIYVHISIKRRGLNDPQTSFKDGRIRFHAVPRAAKSTALLGTAIKDGDWNLRAVARPDHRNIASVTRHTLS